MATKAQKRVLPHVDVKHLSPNHSNRNSGLSLIVVHATAGHNRPGITDLVGLGNYFGTTASQVSSHVCTDNEANSARFVADFLKAWHVAAYNSMSLGIEQMIPGDGTEITEDLYRETARWIAYWHNIHKLPITKAQLHSNGTVMRPGVIRHSELGVLGGGHADPGRFDLNHCMGLARYYAPKQRRVLGL